VVSAYEAARPRAVRLAALALTDPTAFRRKLGDFLLRRGFEYEVVKETVARLLREMQDFAQ
jgi:SOS response regulatory protein OraA/RecX